MAKENEGQLIAKLEFPYEAKNPNNAYARSGNTGKGFKGMFMKKEYKEYKDTLVSLAHDYMLTNYGEEYVPYSGSLKIISYWTFGTRRVKDLQNCGKLEYDALNGIVYEDDSQICMEIKHKRYKKNDPSIILEIYKLENAQWDEK